MYEPECEVSLTSSSSSSQQINKINILNDDKLLKLLNDNFNTEEQQLFINQFKLYLEYGDDDIQFIINFDNVCKWLGFTQKINAKRLLIDKFKENVNYIIKKGKDILLFFKEEQKLGSGGHNKELILLTIILEYLNYV